VEELGDVAKKIDAGGGEDDIVHIEKEVGHLVSPSKDEHGDIAIGSNKAEAMHVVSEALVPSPRGLLEAVEGLVKPTNMLRMSVIDEAGRLLAVDLLIKSAMKKGILDIEMVNGPGA
jgi:hypothetical protein